MIYARKQLPKYCRHKSSGRAFVRIGGKMYYLGKHGSAASRREYDRIIAEFVANGRQAFFTPDEIPIESLIVQYMDYANRELNYSEGRKCRLKRLMNRLNQLYGQQPVSSFGAAALKAIRQGYIDEGIARDTINDYVRGIRQVFDWGAEEEIIPPDIKVALSVVQPLKIGRTSAKEYKDVFPVEDDVLEKTLECIEEEQIRDMIMVQRRIGGRPQDIFNMRFCDIDTSEEIWCYSPYTHKTKKKGKIRELPIGPKSQAILKKYIDGKDKKSEHFVFPRSGKSYHGWYATAITKACIKAGVPHWAPNQLRHAAGTEIRDKFGLEYTQAVLGHASSKMSENYAKVSNKEAFEKAAKVAREIG